MRLAETLLGLIGLYGAVGFVVALIFVFGALPKIDASTRGGTRGFKVLVFPGLVALWPVFLIRRVRECEHPPEERNAHRQTAAKASP